MKKIKINFIDENIIKNNNFSCHVDENKFGFKMYLTAVFIGKMNSGKSHTAIKLAKYLQDNKLITEIFIISPTIQSNPFEILNIPIENQYDNLSNSDLILEKIKNYCENKVNKWKDIKNNYSEEQYNKLYKYIYKIYLISDIKEEKNLIFNENENEENLSIEDIEMLKDNNFERKPNYYKYGPSFLLICDDIMGSNLISNKKSNKICELIPNHRHLHLNIFLLCQNYTNGLPANIRRLISKFFLWKFNDLKEIETFYNEIANSYFSSFDEFRKVYLDITKIKHNFMLIDTDCKNDDLTIRSGFNILYKLK